MDVDDGRWWKGEIDARNAGCGWWALVGSSCRNTIPQKLSCSCLKNRPGGILLSNSILGERMLIGEYSLIGIEGR